MKIQLVGSRRDTTTSILQIYKEQKYKESYDIDNFEFLLSVFDLNTIPRFNLEGFVDDFVPIHIFCSFSLVFNAKRNKKKKMIKCKK